ncbi:hypothetical protein GRF59_14915 [Paenibacillus sp. HJL G12]|uniref:Uncharacterized protein n=1 Tax=Paenibacillus dendrobii TaxID=2691084 RepID=A0A7X3IK99_9BACL|nr:hypothetical protein [Paenibacillus dendrobii]MWV44911.1 hypothetical protein [Paenibacillus dendrobii]
MELIEQYKRSLERKENLLKPYHNKKKGTEDLSVNESITMLILEAEIRLIKEFLEDLDYFIIDKQDG